MKIYRVLLILLCAMSVQAAPRKVQVLTTTTDLADIVGEIGKDKIHVTSLSHGDQSGCSSVEPRPSMVMAARAADLFVRIGLNYDSWADGLVDAARNSKIVFGGPGYVDASVGIERLEVPRGKVDAGMGHVHIYGNPHYWLDPANGKVMADNILAGLIRVSPENTEFFTRNRDAYVRTLDGKISQWQAALAPLHGRRIVSYHKSWEYFARRFGFEIVATIEPKPGIPPSAAHLNRLVAQLKPETGIIILHENIYPVKSSQMLAREIGARVAVLPISTGGMNGAVTSYAGLFDYIVAALTEKQP